MLDENMMLAWRDRVAVWIQMFEYSQIAPALFKSEVIIEEYTKASRFLDLWTV